MKKKNNVGKCENENIESTIATTLTSYGEEKVKGMPEVLSERARLARIW